jgi:hypothetical protein
VVSAAVGALQVRTGGTVSASPVPPFAAPDGEAGPDGAPEAKAPPGPTVAVRHWLRDTLGCGTSAAGAAVRVGVDLRALPLLAAAVREGTVGAAQARILTRFLPCVPLEHLQAWQPQLVQVAARLAPEELAAWVRHMIATWCEPQHQHDDRTAQAKRYLQTREQGDGTTRGSFVLPTASLQSYFTVLEPLARPAGPGDTRSAAQRRADALVEVFDLTASLADLPREHSPPAGAAGAADAGDAGDADRATIDAGSARGGSTTHDGPQAQAAPDAEPVADAETAAGSRRGRSVLWLPDAGELRPHLFYVLSAGWVAGQPPPPFEQLVAASLPGSTSPPAQAGCAIGVWTGPQTRARTEALLCEARISRALLRADGQIANLQSVTGEITRAQRRALIARDRGCAHRGCTRPPAFCDAHHLTAREDGGDTSLDNLVKWQYVPWGVVALRPLTGELVDGRTLNLPHALA